MSEALEAAGWLKALLWIGLNVLPLMWGPLLLVLLSFLAWRPLGGADDFWAHAAIGRWIWGHQRAPQQSLFLWGAPPQAWIYHSWLTQLCFFGLASRGPHLGPWLTNAFTVLMTALPFAVVWRIWTKRVAVPIVAPPLLILAFYASYPRFRPRPELFTALCFVLLLWFLIERPDSTRKWKGQTTIALIFAGFIAWTNLHGAVAMGLVLLGATALADGIQDRFDAASRRLCFLLICAIAAVFVNPYGAHYWSALKPVGSSMFQSIDEWKPFWKWPQLPLRLVWCEGWLWGLAIVAWACNSKRRLSHLLWLALMGAAFLDARRHLWLLALTSLSVLAANPIPLDGARILIAALRAAGWKLARRRATPWLHALGRATTLGIVLAYVIGAGEKRRSPDSWRSMDANLPAEAARFLARAEARRPTRLFNDYENSSYLQWGLAGRPPLYIDLLNAYPPQLLDEYFNVLMAGAGGKNEMQGKRGARILNARHIGRVYLRPYTSKEGLSTLASYLDSQGVQWHRIYARRDGTVWERIPLGRKASP